MKVRHLYRWAIEPTSPPHLRTKYACNCGPQMLPIFYWHICACRVHAKFSKYHDYMPMSTGGAKGPLPHPVEPPRDFIKDNMAALGNVIVHGPAQLWVCLTDIFQDCWIFRRWYNTTPCNVSSIPGAEQSLEHEPCCLEAYITMVQQRSICRGGKTLTADVAMTAHSKLHCHMMISCCNDAYLLYDYMGSSKFLVGK